MLNITHSEVPDSPTDEPEKKEQVSYTTLTNVDVIGSNPETDNCAKGGGLGSKQIEDENPLAIEMVDNYNQVIKDTFDLVDYQGNYLGKVDIIDGNYILNSPNGQRVTLDRDWMNGILLSINGAANGSGLTNDTGNGHNEIITCSTNETKSSMYDCSNKDTNRSENQNERGGADDESIPCIEPYPMSINTSFQQSDVTETYGSIIRLMNSMPDSDKKKALMDKHIQEVLSMVFYHECYSMET